MTGELNLPFEGSAVSPMLDQAAAVFASGLVVMAATIPVPAGDGDRVMPALVFRFAKPDGTGLMPPVVLVVEPGEMHGLARLVREATVTAVDSARAGIRSGDR